MLIDYHIQFSGISTVLILYSSAIPGTVIYANLVVFGKLRCPYILSVLHAHRPNEPSCLGRFPSNLLVVGDAIDAGWYQPGHGMALAARGIYCIPIH